MALAVGVRHYCGRGEVLDKAELKSTLPYLQKSGIQRCDTKA